MPSQIEIWHHLIETFSQVTDRLGKHIDAGILETVVVLNALGMHTTASCEGHRAWGTGAPWVDLAAPCVEEEEKVARSAMQYAKEQRAQGQLKEEEIQRLFQEARNLLSQVNKKHLLERQKLMYYLSAFYAHRTVAYDCMLVTHGLGGITRLESQGAALLPLLTEEERGQKLREYQHEMQEFTYYLKRWFFQEAQPKSG